MSTPRTPEDVEAQWRQEWREKLARCVLAGKTPIPVPTVNNHFQLQINGWDVHALYTVLVEPIGPEGCCAGCTRLPRGWCAACDRDRDREEAKKNAG